MKQILNPDHVCKPVGQYSQCVKASGSQLVFIAGQVAVNEHGELVGKGDIEAQARQVLTNIQALVRAAGGSMQDIVETVTYDTDIKSHVDGLRKVRAEFFSSGFPAGAKVEVKGLVDPDYLLEMSAIAVIE